MEQVIGIDLAKRVFQLHIASPPGKMIKNTVVTRDKLMTFIAQQPPSKIVMEACGSANYWSRQFKRFGHEVKQISPQYVAPFRMGSKVALANKNARIAWALVSQQSSYEPR
ncbi:hypothetical protein Ppb6_00127 [Photorhabdus australis subsp. thailandensis]|uniref:Transposase n=2 Tax=Photorhabdus australis subsp. thailandensis TaxID=2805096 RepID=A0A1C0U9X9_9GAMM|nr:IS110 family transposase [Photorhabdus australis]OCQ54666.1 hypothetical protein Ppb6_00127 [Photorhabdus australis subsp. thailandensis]